MIASDRIERRKPSIQRNHWSSKFVFPLLVSILAAAILGMIREAREIAQRAKNAPTAEFVEEVVRRTLEPQSALLEANTSALGEVARELGRTREELARLSGVVESHLRERH